MSEGWIALHRRFFQWEWWSDINTSRVFITLLLMANHENGRWRGNEIKRGQLITSLSKLSQITNLSIKQIRVAIEKLKTTEEIGTQRGKAWTLITINNYSQYQDVKEKKGTGKGIKRAKEGQGEGKEGATNNNNNNNNNENNIGVPPQPREFENFTESEITQLQENNFKPREIEYWKQNLIGWQANPDNRTKAGKLPKKMLRKNYALHAMVCKRTWFTQKNLAWSVVEHDYRPRYVVEKETPDLPSLPKTQEDPELIKQIEARFL